MKSLRATIALPFQNQFARKIRSLNRKEARQAFEKRCRTLAVPFQRKISDTTVGRIPVRIYQPYNATDETIVFFHGGGFVYGSLDSHDQLARLLASYTHQTIISVGYSLAPDAKHPTQIEEALLVLEDIPSLCEKYGFETRRVSLAGDSAGGFIALQTALKYNGELAHLILLYPGATPDDTATKTMQKYGEHYFLTATDIRQSWKSLLGTKTIPSYTDTALSKLPPVLWITAEYDALRSEAHILHDQLRNAGHSSTYVMYHGMWHGFLQVPWPMSKRRKALRRIAKFVQKY